MHYNQFTIDYIESIKRNLNIIVNENGEAVYFPDSIENESIENLKIELSSIWVDAENSIDIVRSKHDAMIQSGLFGLVNDLDLALKTGFLLGDRVVLVDYLFERLLKKKNPDQIDRVHLGVISSSLVNVLPLAKNGRIVIIPNPFNWHPKSKQIIDEAIDKVDLTPNLMSMLNMLSITQQCQLHPYTIAESEENYSLIVNSHIDTVDMLGKDSSVYAYEGILGALLSERLLNGVEFTFPLNVPISKYSQIISSSEDFYLKYLEKIVGGGSINGENNIDLITDDFLKELKEKNKINLGSLAKKATTAASIGGSSLALASAVSVVSSSLGIAGAILSLSATLTGLVNQKEKNQDTVISVFKQLYNA